MTDDPSKETRLPVVDERLTLEKRPVVTSRLRVRTHTESVETTASAELDGEEIEITRVPVDRIVETTPETRVEGDVTILPVVEERVVVEKFLVLKEEIHIRRRPTRERVDVPVSLRRQHAVFERIDPETGAVISKDTHPHRKD
jgi:stress response protein YsnF